VARAGQGVGAGRLALALAASFAAHGALLGALPRWEAASFSLTTPALERLQVGFRPAEPVVPSTARPVPAPAPLPLAPRYYAAHELERRPQILSQVEPAFPALALTPVGRVVLQLYVDEDGRVERIATERDDPHGQFARAAREAFVGARFLPGVKDGSAVKSVVRLEVRFGAPHPDNSAP
jgi:TonB family protein